MTHDRVFDFGGIQAQLLHSRIHLIFNGIIKDSVEYNDAIGSGDGPYGILGLSKPVKIVGDLNRFGMPGGWIRGRCATALATASTGLSALCALARLSSPPARRRRSRTDEVEQVRIILSCESLRCSDVCIG